MDDTDDMRPKATPLAGLV